MSVSWLNPFIGMLVPQGCGQQNIAIPGAASSIYSQQQNAAQWGQSQQGISSVVAMQNQINAQQQHIGGDIFWSPPKYSQEDFVLAIGMDTNKGRLISSDIIIQSGPLLFKVYCYNLKKEITVSLNEITDIPKLDKLKTTKMYKMANPPVEYKIRQGTYYGNCSLVSNGLGSIVKYVVP